MYFILKKKTNSFIYKIGNTLCENPTAAKDGRRSKFIIISQNSENIYLYLFTYNSQYFNDLPGRK